MKPSMPAMATPSKKPFNCFSSNSSSLAGKDRCLLIDGGGRKSSARLRRSSLRIDISHNLMHTLTTQVELIRNLAERLSGRTHFKNLLISINICRRPWTKRSPNPARYIRELSSSFFGKLIFTKTLPGVTNPSSQINFGIFEFFNMCGRYVSVALSRSKLLQSSDVSIETCGVVHSRDINTRMRLNVGALLT